MTATVSVGGARGGSRRVTAAARAAAADGDRTHRFTALRHQGPAAPLPPDPRGTVAARNARSRHGPKATAPP